MIAITFSSSNQVGIAVKLISKENRFLSTFLEQYYKLQLSLHISPLKQLVASRKQQIQILFTGSTSSLKTFKNNSDRAFCSRVQLLKVAIKLFAIGLPLHS